MLKFLDILLSATAFQLYPCHRRLITSKDPVQATALEGLQQNYVVPVFYFCKNLSMQSTRKKIETLLNFIID